MSIKLTPEQLDTMRQLLVVLEGKDPEAQQTINRFMNVDSNLERTNLPTRRDVHFMAYLDFVGRTYFASPKNPFSILGDSVATCFMAFKGLKSQQVVDLLRNQPDLSSLQMGVTDEEKRGLMDRVLGRNKNE